jgi:DNA-directed RNA polymerase, omega subunit
VSKQISHYDRLSAKIPYKYAIPIAVAKRAEALKEYAKPYVTPVDNNPVSIAFQEIQSWLCEDKERRDPAHTASQREVIL